MLGFSITKLLFTIVAVYAVWQGFKWYNRAQEIKAARKEPLRNTASKPAATTATTATQETIKCDVCDTYIPSDTSKSCGRADCPYPG